MFTIAMPDACHRPLSSPRLLQSHAYARPRDLLLVDELDYFNPRKHRRVMVDGTLNNILRLLGKQGFKQRLEKQR
jgi:hypothetical protein